MIPFLPMRWTMRPDCGESSFGSGSAKSTFSMAIGMADSRLRIPAGNAGTARNMNTIAKLVEMATGL